MSTPQIFINGKLTEPNPFSFDIKLRNKSRIRKEYIVTPIIMTRDQYDDLVNNEYQEIKPEKLLTLPPHTTIAYRRKDNGKFVSGMIVVKQVDSKEGEPLTLVAWPNNNGYISKKQRDSPTPKISPFSKAFCLKPDSLSQLFIVRDKEAESIEQLFDKHKLSADFIKKLVAKVTMLEQKVAALERAQLGTS